MLLKPILNEPALLVNNKILVIADLHIGIENELHEQGINTNSKTDLMKEHLSKLCDEFHPKDILILGDLKHNIPVSTIQERKDVINFVDHFQKFAKIHIIPGNHDGNIQVLSDQNVLVHPSGGFLLDGIGFVHGHKWPSEEIMQCDQIVMAHSHPTILLKDRLGHKNYEPCWIKGSLIEKNLKEKYPESKTSKVLIVPAFNPLCGGIAVNCDGIAGPIGKLIDVPNSQIYLIDGTSLGKVKDIK